MQVFEPLVDDLGLFEGATSRLTAVEFFDPGADLGDCTIAQPSCDMNAILSELRQDISTLDTCKQTHLTNVQKAARDNSDSLSDNNLDAVMSSCSCWSPKVEFLDQSQVYRLDMMKTWNHEGKSDIDPVTASVLVPQNSEQLVIKPSSGRGKGLSSRSDGQLNSLREYLRFFHLACLKLNSQRQSEDAQPHPYASSNPLVEAIAQHPEIYHLLRKWHVYQDAQKLLANVYTAALLVGNRVKVYRSSGTTQWFTAVIIAYDEPSKLMTLIDDTVLEEHQEDPTLLEMHLIDDGLVQSIIEGRDVSLAGGFSRRRTQRINQRQVVAMNPSASISAGLSAGQSEEKQAKNKSVSGANHTLSLCSSNNSSSSASHKQASNGADQLQSSTSSSTDDQWASSRQNPSARSAPRAKSRRNATHVGLGQTAKETGELR